MRPPGAGGNVSCGVLDGPIKLCDMRCADGVGLLMGHGMVVTSDVFVNGSDRGDVRDLQTDPSGLCIMLGQQRAELTVSTYLPTSASKFLSPSSLDRWMDGSSTSGTSIRVREGSEKRVDVGEEGQWAECAETCERRALDRRGRMKYVHICQLFSQFRAACIPATVSTYSQHCLSHSREAYYLPTIYRQLTSSSMSRPGASGSVKEATCGVLDAGSG
ncbi:hypothetical protein EDB92DRAFT_2105707 [Lactarius akahatsu]|uniref:Uncharacterized protein n=1 Tax=Lactarius akahatsu TaxID=416441 RepID=A0AAD4Q7T9_9AGAM|nr:hypothetical protein EDB92DRAFT_2105707 [Lactarius akahatsu]